MRLLSKIFCLLLVGFLGGCSGEEGRLSLSLTDSAADQYKAVYVTIDEVVVHKEGESEESWTAVALPKKTYNLLELTNGVRETLGLASLSAGHYTQVRLLIGGNSDGGINILSQQHPFANYVIDQENEVHKLKIPSGEQSGTKIVHEFDISESGTTELILDFDASKSVVVAGKSGQFLLKPTIKILNTAEYAILSGTVSNSSSEAVEGAQVTAQIFDSDAEDVKDEVIVKSGTITDEVGLYQLFLEPETYNIIVTKEGFNPAFRKETFSMGDSLTENFNLTTASMGEVAGAVTISGGDGETFVTISFRQLIMNELLSNEKIEVDSTQVVHGGDYLLSLPSGNYEVVSSTFDKETQSEMITVSPDARTTHNVSF